MGKINLLLDRKYLVGVSQQERITPGDRHALGHPCLRTTYTTNDDSISQQDFFRGATARYWSFKTGDSYETYADFGYLNKTEYHGTLHPGDVAILNTEGGNHKIAFTIGGAAASSFVKLPFLPSDPGAAGNWSMPEVEWGIEEVGVVSLEGGFNSILNDPVVWPDPTAPWSQKPPLWPYFGYPTNLGSPEDSLPAGFRNSGGPLPPAPGQGTIGMNNLARKKYVIINSRDTVWTAASAEAGMTSMNDVNNPTANNPAFSLDEWTPTWGDNWANYRGWWYDIGATAGAGGVAPWTDDTGTSYPGFVKGYARVYTANFFKDHAHKFFTPYGVNHPINLLGGSIAIKTAKIEPKYNYFSKGYEKAIENSDLDERLLPNSYMVYNYIDYYHPSASRRRGSGTRIDGRMRKTLRRLNCFWEGRGNAHGGWMPNTRGQISQLGYGSPKRSYLQKYASHNQGTLGALTSPDWNYRKGEIMSLNSHIGFTKEMMESDFVDYGEREDFPFGISIEFDTVMPGENTKLAKIFDDGDMDWAYDFITNNIILMNLQDWDWQACGGEPYTAYNETMAIAAQVTEYIPIDAKPDTPGLQLHLDAKHSYYGFDWAAPAETDGVTYWGYGPCYNSGMEAAAAPTGSEDTGDKNRDDYDAIVSNAVPALKCLDVGRMFDYANMSRRMPSAEEHSLTYGTTPSPILGQADKRGVARHQGVLVGAKHMLDGGNSATLWRNYAPKDVYNNQGPGCGAGSTVPTDSGFRDLLRAFEKVINQNSRSYLEMINGKLAYCETLAYKVDKYRVHDNDISTSDDDVLGDLIQTFYFPNIRALDKIKYVDTQVKYGVKYKYVVYAYNLVIGNQYCYENIPLGPSDKDGDAIPTAPPWTHPFYAHQFISAKIIETPYYEFETAQVRDLPPVFPEIETVPFKGINNKIRFLMQTQNVKYAFNPDQGSVKLWINEDEDKPRYRLQREFQQRPIGPIVFGSDDTEITFEIYRMTQKPTAYTDFAPHLHATVEGILSTGQRAVNLGFDDDIKPNTKYYYTFRCIDYHKGLSIPSPIYHVEIVDDNGRMFPVTGVYYISNHVDISKIAKPFRKYLQIGAAFAQKIIKPAAVPANLQPSVEPPSGLLGTSDSIASENSVWSEPGNKKVFKIRLTSKSTSKKLDLNVRLEEVPIINPIEES